MPALDQCHEQVVRALQKDGWTVERAPANYYTPDRAIYIDLELSRGLNGSRRQIMLVEIKCFADKSGATTDLYVSIGQYLVYRAMLAELGLAHTMYLSVPEHVFAAVFDPVVMRVVSESQINLVLVNVSTEIVVRWIEQSS